jgi:hypothetical protein
VTPAEIEDFINSGHTETFLSVPDVGYHGARRLALRAVARENKLAIYTGGESDPDTYVFISAERSGDGVEVQLVRPFPVPVLYISRINPINPRYTTWRDEAESLHEQYEDSWDNLTTQAVARLEGLPVWTEPPHSVIVHFMTWAEYSPNPTKTGPMGIVAVAPEGRRLVGVPFPGREADTGQWGHWKGLPVEPAQGLLAVGIEAGFHMLLGEPRTSAGHSWEDAAERALHTYGAEIYRDTNRSMFQ